MCNTETIKNNSCPTGAEQKFPSFLNVSDECARSSFQYLGS